jgi:hypothetical protein
LNGTLIDPGEAGLTLEEEAITETTFINESGKLVIGSDREPGQLTIRGAYKDKSGNTVNATAVVVVIDTSKTNIKDKFVTDPTLTGVDAVAAAFRELSAFIADGGLTKGVIQLNDYIDLEGGLTVEAYKEAGGFSYAGDNSDWIKEITLKSGSAGQMNRLIVVGINSFRDNESYVYPKGENEPAPPDHVVFQFQSVPVKRWMNAPVDTLKGDKNTLGNTNAGGYPASEMRRYLTKVAGDPESGNFLDGLMKTAGVPEEVLWGPSRVMETKGNGLETINDLLWLPTEREIYGEIIKPGIIGSSNLSGPNETAENQVRLDYYTLNKFRDKPMVEDAAVQYSQFYWLASAANGNDTQFCHVGGAGSLIANAASGDYGVAPAFCVKGWPETQQ